MELLNNQNGDNLYAYCIFPQITQILDSMTSADKSCRKDALFMTKEAYNPDTHGKITIYDTDRKNTKHLKHWLGILAQEKKLFRDFNINEKVADAGKVDTKNRHNFEKMQEIKDLNNLLLHFMQLIMTKMYHYSGPYTYDGADNITGSDPTYIADDIVKAQLNKFVQNTEGLFNFILNWKFGKKSDQVIAYENQSDNLEAQNIFKENSKRAVPKRQLKKF